LCHSQPVLQNKGLSTVLKELNHSQKAAQKLEAGFVACDRNVVSQYTEKQNFRKF